MTTESRCGYQSEDGSCNYDGNCSNQTGRYKEICSVYEEDDERDCENCAHYVVVRTKYYALGSEDIYGCESWECKFEPKEEPCEKES